MKTITIDVPDYIADYSITLIGVIGKTIYVKTGSFHTEESLKVNDDFSIEVVNAKKKHLKEVKKNETKSR